MKKYTIKPLVWEEYTLHNLKRCNLQTIFCNFYVEERIEERLKLEHKVIKWSYCVEEYYDEDSGYCDSLEEGKSICEKEFMNRLLPALKEIE